MKRVAILLLLYSLPLLSQSNLVITGPTIDSSQADHTLPMKIIATTAQLPTLGCKPGEMIFVISSKSIYESSTTGGCTWAVIGGGGGGTGGGLADPGSNGVVFRSSLNVTRTAASSDIVGLFTGCVGSLFLGADGACHSGGGGGTTPPGGVSGQIQTNVSGSTFGGITVTGDAAINGTTGALSLTTVNSAPGTCGDSTHVGQIVVNAKGLTTGCTPVVISGGGGGGMADPGANGVIFRSALNVTRPAVFGDIFALFTGCSGSQYPGFDGTCHSAAATTPGGTNGQIEFNNSGALGGFTMSGDATINTGTGVITVTKTGGVSFAPSATINTQDATNIISGTLPVPRGGTGVGTITGIAKGNGTSAFTTAGSADIINLFSSCSGTQYLGADGICHPAPPGATPYVTNATTSPQTITAVTAGQGINPIVVCFSGAVSAGHVTGTDVASCTYQQDPSGAAGDRIVTYTGGTVGSIWVGSAGSGTGGGGGSATIPSTSQVICGDGAGNGALCTPNLTASNVILSTGSYANPSWIASLAAGKLTGILTVPNGGTGAATLTGIPKGNGTSAFTAALAADIVSLFSGTGCSGTQYLSADGFCHALPGAGSTIPSTTQVICGDGAGNGALCSPNLTASNVILSTGTYSNPAWITALASTKISGVTGVVKGTGTALVAAAVTDIVGLFTACSGTQYLGADGNCHTPSTGTAGGTNGQIQFNSTGAFGGFTMSGDATINTGTGVITVTKTGGAAFAPSATTDTTNAVNITNGILSVQRGGTGVGTITGITKGNGVSAFTAATSTDIINLFTACSGTQYLGADGACHAAAAGANPYVVNASTAPQAIPAATHGQGINPIVTCWSGALSAGHVTGSYIPCPYQQNGSGAAGDLIVSYTAGEVGSIWVGSAGSGGGGGGSGATIPATSQIICGDGSGNGALCSPNLTASNVIVSTGTYSNPGWITALAASKITGTMPVANGGTGVVTLTGIPKANGTSAFSSALASDIVGLFSACSGTQYLGADGACHNTSGTGTVTNVGLLLPGSIFTISGSPVTNSGVLTGAFINQTANLFFSGPASGVPAVPTMRTLVAADVAFAGTLTNSISGNAATATSPRTTPTLCTTGNIARGVDTSFNAVCVASGTGTVSTSGTMTTTAIVTWAGSSAIQTPNASLVVDTLGDVLSPGAASFAHGINLSQGPDPGSLGSNSFQLISNPSIPLAYRWMVPSADVAGFIVTDGAGSPGHLSSGTLSGDVSSSGRAVTFNSVNSVSGLCGDASHVCQVQTNAKGLVISQTAVAIAGSGLGTVTSVSGASPLTGTVTTTGSLSCPTCVTSASAVTSGHLVIGAGAQGVQLGDLSGDISTAGGTAATLATVNAGPGACGDSTHVCQVTTNGKGLVTSQTAVGITGTGSSTLTGDITGTTSASVVSKMGPQVVLLGSADLQTAICALPAAGGTIVLNANTTVSANINACSKSSVQVQKAEGVTLSLTGHSILNSGTNYTGQGYESYESTSSTVACSDCPGATPRPIDQPVIFTGLSTSPPGFQQTDAAVMIGRNSGDSIGLISDLARTTLSVRTDYSGTSGTAWGILSQMKVSNTTSGKGNFPILAYMELSSSVTGSGGGGALFGSCDLHGSSGGCAGLAIETGNTTPSSGTLYGIIVNQQASVGSGYTNWGILNSYSFPDAALSLTDVVTNGTSTVTSATGGFTTGMIGDFISIINRGIFFISGRSSSNSITITAVQGTYGLPPSGSGLTAYVGSNPGFGYQGTNAGGHNVGGLLVTENHAGGPSGQNDFFTAQFESSYTKENIVQLVNAPATDPSTSTGFVNRLQFWRGALGPVYTAPIVQAQHGYETSELISDITTTGSYSQGYMKIKTDIGAVLTDTAQFDQFGVIAFVGGVTVPHSMTVSSLNSTFPCTSAREGMIVGVTDLANTTINATAVGSGGIHLPLYCNSAAWVIF